MRLSFPYPLTLCTTTLDTDLVLDRLHSRSISSRNAGRICTVVFAFKTPFSDWPSQSARGSKSELLLASSLWSSWLVAWQRQLVIARWAGDFTLHEKERRVFGCAFLRTIRLYLPGRMCQRSFGQVYHSVLDNDMSHGRPSPVYLKLVFHDHLERKQIPLPKSVRTSKHRGEKNQLR